MSKFRFTRVSLAESCHAEEHKSRKTARCRIMRTFRFVPFKIPSYKTCTRSKSLVWASL